MRRIDSEISSCLASGNLEKACRLAKAVEYFIEVFDGDGETGMLEPDISISKKWPDIGEDFYGRNL